MGSAFARLLVIIRRDCDHYAGFRRAHRQDALAGRLGSYPVGDHAWPDTGPPRNVSANIAGFTHRKCDSGSSGESGSGSLDAACNPAITRFHADPGSRRIERLHGPHAMDERFTTRGLEPACATHVDSCGRDRGYYMDAATRKPWAL